jgi:hypothetical protein
MSLDGRQIFVWEGSVDRVSELIRRYVEKVGSEADVELDAEKWSTERPRRTEREFTLSDPRNGIITIWEAREFARRHALPFACVYPPDPSLAVMSELAKKAFQDLLGMEPELEGRVEVEYNFDSDEMQAEDLVETEAEVEALKRQRAEIASFPKLTIPCK